MSEIETLLVRVAKERREFSKRLRQSEPELHARSQLVFETDAALSQIADTLELAARRLR
jgi:hypothetical protein